jgi:hypothetical protein
MELNIIIKRKEKIKKKKIVLHINITLLIKHPTHFEDSAVISDALITTIPPEETPTNAPLLPEPWRSFNPRASTSPPLTLQSGVPVGTLDANLILPVNNKKKTTHIFQYLSKHIL